MDILLNFISSLMRDGGKNNLNSQTRKRSLNTSHPPAGILIALFNVDYKILAIILASRLNIALSHCIHLD